MINSNEMFDAMKAMCMITQINEKRVDILHLQARKVKNSTNTVASKMTEVYGRAVLSSTKKDEAYSPRCHQFIAMRINHGRPSPSRMANMFEAIAAQMPIEAALVFLITMIEVTRSGTVKQLLLQLLHYHYTNYSYQQSQLPK